MKPCQVFVRGINKYGKHDTIDVLDLDDRSFRAFIVTMLYQAGIVTGIASEYVKEKEIVYREKKK